MSPVDIESVTQKLVKLEKVILELDAIRKIPKEKFIEDVRLQAATQWFLIHGIEIITDIGNHLLVEKASVTGTSYENIIEQLGNQHLISKALAERNKGMAKFRNLLVHIYEKVDIKLVYQYSKDAPKEFRQFAKEFSQYIKY